MGEAGHVINESGNELIPCELRLIPSLSALNKLQSFVLSSCGQKTQYSELSSCWNGGNTSRFEIVVNCKVFVVYQT